MTFDQSEEMIRRWFDEVWNKKNSAAIREMLSDDSVHHGLGDEPRTGAAAFEDFYNGMVTAFPDVNIEVHKVGSEGDLVTAEFTVTGTNSGELFGQPATGKKVRFPGGGRCRMDAGKFVEVWNEVNFEKMQYDLAPDTPDVE